jgi:hypothetical protein
MRMLFSAGVLLISLSGPVVPRIVPQALQDSDHDGLSDALEQALLVQFAPRFMLSVSDCSVQPAQFVPFQANPVVQADNGTIYGQVFPRAGHSDQVEVHYYHLWRSDCGEMGHNLDTEHVSALLSRDGASAWKALYWYASAHEDTVCDASQIARAATLDAERQGPRIWISRGKHASFLSYALCAHGCGGDDCSETERLAITRLINLGELNAPMNGATWIASPEWPLAAKMRRSDFTGAHMISVDQLPPTSIAWANPGKRPMQAAIRSGKYTVDGVAAGQRATSTALDLADSNTGQALGSAAGSTGNGISMALRGVGKALNVTARKVGDAIGAK